MVDRAHAATVAVPGIREVLHATFRDHAYPAHTHDAWTLLLIDRGAVRYALDRGEHIAAPASLSLLPPHIPHDGRSAVTGTPFRKRVLYLDPAWLPGELAGAAASRPALDADAVAAARRVHAALAAPGDEFAAESELVMLRGRVRAHLRADAVAARRDDPLARRLRAVLDERYAERLIVAELAVELHAHPSHLIRAFSRAYGMPPHRYVTGRRVDLARRLLVAGSRPAEAAASAGFHDQAHLTRHFRAFLGTTPAAFVA
ncbi:AraC family transcriptional regulator [Microbacterium sp. 10M-3C3]|uniref:helix-turn-helix transcriptional regulator n=1 Tax=Microbacterium sp. 10M-3C3 TaxID=2483401 RepID=UPI00197B3FBD|nr:AraC family transcriptional regulator [Microbacterium sp. 10M-3C3]